MKLPILLFVLTMYNYCESAYPNVYKEIVQVPTRGNPGKPLILTPLLEAGRIKEAQKLSKVHRMKGVQSYSGYFTVDKNFDSNMFFWFFPAKKDYRNAPVVLWLQGGPGASSLFGLFAENGPLEFTKKRGLRLRKHSWSEDHSVIYIDNPVGVGYSFTNSDGYSTNETAVGNNLYAAMLQFFQLFPELQKNEFFVTGESYGGKYVPALSYTIHRRNPTAEQKINLKGLAIGDGLSDPIHQTAYGDYLYQIGLIDINAKLNFYKLERQGIDYMKAKEFTKASEVFDEILGLFQNLTGSQNYYNFLRMHEDDNTDFGDFVQRTSTRAAIHVGNTPYAGAVAGDKLTNDIMQSVAPWISELLSYYRVLIYNGQVDIIIAYPLTLNYLQHLQFDGAKEYATASRFEWHVGEDIAGFVKTAGNLTELLVRDSGHMVPKDQPVWAHDMIRRFTRNIPFH